MSIRNWFYIVSIVVFVCVHFISTIWAPVLYFYILFIPLFLLGIYDIFQTKSNILRNYPVWGHWRYILLLIRPQIHQYFVTSDQNGRPFNKEMRDLVYHRAHKTLDVLPFGTQRDVNAVGHEWINHSLHPTSPDPACMRVQVGNAECKKPYLASRLNISAMSFGALSKNAVLALNKGAKLGEFAHNTGEGGLSKHHLAGGGDIIWQIGTGYFGCRTEEGKFDPSLFQQKAGLDAVKMIEIKLSQGAKPAHGGVLPGVKVTEEIAEARNIEIGKDCISPPAHSAFSTPLELIEFVQTLKELSGGKPVGFKLCLGLRSDFMAICKAMLKLKSYPDFIVVDGSEGGTGAAPVEFTDSIGTPLNIALSFIHNVLVGAGLRGKMKLIASGKIITGFDMACKFSLGADLCNSARGMLFSLGCVQSRRCHNNTCPTGITTQNPHLYYGLDVDSKAVHVKNFHEATLESFREVIGAAGMEVPEQLTPTHIHHNVADSTPESLSQIYPFLNEGELLSGEIREPYARYWMSSEAENFAKFDNAFGRYWSADSKFYLRGSHKETNW
jgi:glutamate synthase domain-containing protein 2